MKTFKLLLLLFAFTAMSCDKEAPEDPENLSETLLNIGEAELQSGEYVTVFSEGNLHTGYQKIYIEVVFDAEPVTDATVQLQPRMEMTGGMEHGSPAIAPEYNSEARRYEGAAIFTMASGGGFWLLDVTVNGETHEFPVQVNEAGTNVVNSYTGTDEMHYVISLFPTEGFKVGQNTFTLVVSRQHTMLVYEQVPGLQIEFTPEMPSMGHSSPNNTNPTDIGNGLYQGSANFTMTGDWRLYFDISKNDTILLEDVYLDIRL